MTNNQDFPGIPPAKIYNPTTKTYQVAYFEQQPEQNQSAEKNQKVADSYQVEVDACQDISVQKSYGPCSYSGCNHKNKSFGVDISIQGCKWWARNPGEGTSLPGYWQQSPSGSYYWRENLWLNHMGHGQDADSLIGRNHLYTVNTVGLYAMEDDEFCAGTQNFIRECIRKHEQGYDINEPRILPSETTRATKWTIKAGVAIASIATANPLGLAAVGGATWVSGEIVKSTCDSDKKFNHVWSMVSSTGSDMVKGAVISNAIGTGSQIIGEAATGGSRVGGELFKKYAEGIGDKIEYGITCFGLNYHLAHLNEGRNYDKSCGICND